MARVRFLRSHVDTIYDRLTAGRSRFVRLEHLAVAAADVVPGMVPNAHQIEAEAGRLQGEKRRAGNRPGAVSIGGARE